MSKDTTKQSIEKRQFIIDNAREVFFNKGYANVTMQDIVNQCDISRGGIYIYFDSVQSIFKEVLKQRETKHTDTIKKQIEEQQSFETIVNNYLEAQRQRLLNMDQSLLRAVYEYHFTHQDESDVAFRKDQVNKIRANLTLILNVGVKENIIEEHTVDFLADQMMFIIEGLSVYALLGGLKTDTIDEQFSGLKKQLFGGQA